MVWVGIARCTWCLYALVHLTSYVQLVSAVGVYIGCFHDGSPDLMREKIIFTNINQTICNQHCRSKNFPYTYLGLKAGNECWCGKTNDQYGRVPPGGCGLPCSGYPALRCGGYTEFSVYTVCPRGFFGSGCDQRCDCKDQSLCTRREGYCDECPSGYYSYTCALRCHCRAGAPCDKTFGTCPSGCAPGWTGRTCDDCAAGYFGALCDNRCHCILNYNCSRSDGHCPYGCAASWTGPSCNITDVDECANNTHICAHGRDHCHDTAGSYTCTCRSGYRLNADGQSCDDIDECQNTGANLCSQICINTQGGYNCSCHGGFQLSSENGQACEECAAGQHGMECTTTCSSNCQDNKCHSSNGTCILGCIGDWQGDTCQNNTPPEPHDSATVPVFPIIGGVCGAIALFAIIVIIVKLVSGKSCMTSSHIATEAMTGASIVGDFPAEMHNGATATAGYAPLVLEGQTRPQPVDEDAVSVKEEKQTESPTTPGVTVPVNIGHLKNLMMKLSWQGSAGYRKEYKKLPVGRFGTCTAGVIPEMVHGNKFKDILPYDHNRVVLRLLDHDPHSHYINASSVQISGTKDKYIATKAPQESTVNDFWRMVWETRSTLIVMLNNPVENEQEICMEYWPNEQQNSHKFGKTTITLLGQVEALEFCMRALSISRDGKERVVKQYHFKTWSGLSVPNVPTGLLKMLQKIHSEPNMKPIIVHCSTGVGRTGTFIAIDQLLKQADRDGMVDVVACVSDLRKSRMKMVDSWVQYQFIYDAVLEGVTVRQSCFPCDAYCDARELQDTFATTANHFQFLESTTKPLTDEDLSASLAPPHKVKNRYSDIIPANSSRVHLKPSTSAGSDYVNAVYVNGLHNVAAYIATQVACEDTVLDFWDMVVQHQSKSIVVLENSEELKTLPVFLPGPSEPLKVGEYTIRLASTRTDGEVEVLDVTVTKPSSVAEVPTYPLYTNNRVTLVNMEAIELAIRVTIVTRDVTKKFLVQCALEVSEGQRSKDNPPVVVVCRDGASKCGLFLAVSILIKMITDDQLVDVFYAVRTIRQQRPQFITSQEQYNLLHQIAAMYLQTFGTYSSVN